MFLCFRFLAIFLVTLSRVNCDSLKNGTEKHVDLLKSQSESEKSAKAEQSSAPPLTEIALADILRDLSGGLSKPRSRDFIASAGSNPKRTIVGVKKHKNYEIVLYEYEDEESLAAANKDFDIEEGPQQLSSDGNKKPKGLRSGLTGPTRRRKKSRKNNGKNQPSSRSPQRELPSPEEIGLPPSPIETEPLPPPEDIPPPPPFRESSHRRNKTKSASKSKPKRPLEDQDDETEDNSPRYDDDDEESKTAQAPFDWGQREKPRRNQKSRNRQGPFDNEDDDEESDQVEGEVEDYGDEYDWPVSVNKTSRRPSSRRPAQTSSANGRHKFQDAPGAGRFVPRRRPESVFVSSRGGNHSINDDEDEAGDYVDSSEEESRIACKDPTGKAGICEEYYKCSVLYSANGGRINLQDYKCRLEGKEIGICCPLFDEQEVQGQTRGRNRNLVGMMMGQKKKKPLSKQIKRLIKSNVNSSIVYGSDSVAQLDEIEQDLFSRGGQVAKGSPAFGHNRFFPSSKKIRQVSEVGFELLLTSNDLSERLQLTNEIGGVGLKSFKSSNVRAINDRCPRLPPCGINKYRLIDGSCNNLRRQKMGQSLTPLSRVLEPAYADGRWEPRISVKGYLLPSARLLSQTFIRDRDNPNPSYTLFTMQFGQFIDHDISSVPIFTFANGTGISCCRDGQFLPPEDRHPNCMPIEIPPNDPFYGRFNQRCMNFVRSRMAPRIDCSLGYADQMNAVTHWLDLSNVYGSSEAENRKLRLFRGGLLEFSELEDRKMLLPTKINAQTRELDYKAGDDRVNEMQGLMIMHLVWLREHNRVAFELERLNPFWTDEQLFQESRRIVIAEYQHIIYNEWLPIIVGREYMESYGILPLNRKKYFKGYDPEIDASIESAFSSAAFRMGHSLVQGMVRLINELGQSNEGVEISKHAENAERTRAPNQIDKWIRGLAQQPIQSFDPFVTQHINGRLFQARGGMFGLDLSSLNIQRGRDHGVPGYNAFRELCQTGKKAKTFDDFRDWIAPEIVENMRRVYDHPDDVDLYIGGLSEAPLKGALIGPTFTCIVGDQFARTKKGDRYFMDIGDQTHSFSPEQLQELKKASMARIMCDNGDNLEAIQPSVFLQPDFDFNSLVDCQRSRRISRINLRLWENEPLP